MPLPRRPGHPLTLLFNTMVCVTLLAGAAAHAEPPAAAPLSAPLRVTCVGDSLTMGVGTLKPAEESYPAQLQALLGPSWQVLNFGVGGRTLLRKADPYDIGRALKSSPDVVLIMLGTNDAKAATWAAHKDEFVADYVAVVKKFQDLPSKPKVLACLPPPAFPGNWTITETVIGGEVVPAIKEAAKAAGIPVVDTHTPLVDAKALFPDTVHPNREGAARIAALIAAAVKDLQLP